MLRYALLVAFGSALAVVGCNQQSGIKTYPVTGTVTYNGKPVSGATVSYMNDADASAPRSSGSTDSDGRFSLSTFVGPREVLRGAPSGSYKVAIVKMSAEVQQAAAGSANWENLSEKERQAQMSNMWQKRNEASRQGAPSKPKSEIPERYGKPESSGLTATVVVGENEAREFKLTDD